MGKTWKYRENNFFPVKVQFLRRFFCRIPENFYIDSLTEDHICQINSLWHHRFDGSDKFISYTIKNHKNAGLFNYHKELVAWCLRYDNGSLGILQVAENHRRKGYGSLVTKFLSKKIAKEEKSAVISLIVPGNVKSEKMFEKLGFKNLGQHSSLIVTQRKEKT
jgi:GNAT superfamily N-acetyltransferase